MRAWIFSLWGLCGLSLLGGCWRETDRCGSDAHCPGRVCDLEKNVCVPQKDADLSAGVEPDGAAPPDAATPPPPDSRMAVVLDQRMPAADLCTGLYQVKIAGAVTLDMPPNDLGAKGANRLAKGPCPGKPFIMVDGMTPRITNAELGEAVWECSDPSYYYGTHLMPGQIMPEAFTPVCLRAATQAFAVQMPAGYTCTQGYYHLNGTQMLGTFRKDADPRRCTLDIPLPAPGAVPWIYIWFTVMPQ